MRRAAVLAFCAIALPAAAQAPRPAPDVLLQAPRTGGLAGPLRAAPCAFDPAAEHLGWLPSDIAWAQPAALVMTTGLPGLRPGERAVVLRPTRGMLAARATRARIAAGGISLHGRDLAILPAESADAAFLAIHVPPPAAPPVGCHAQTPR